MRIARLAELFVSKYADHNNDSLKRLEGEIRSNIHVLWKFPNELFNILSACAKSEPKHPKNADQVKAITGFKFCQQLLAMIDYMQANRDTISLSQLKEILSQIINLIKINIHLKFDASGKPSNKGEISEVQFPHVAELIFEMIPVRTKQDRVIRDQQFGKAKTGLSRILSFSLSMLEKLSKLEMLVPEQFDATQFNQEDISAKRFIPQRVSLSIHDLIDFIRQHGQEYGISTTEDWETLFLDDPKLKEQMTTVINAINRGHYPKDASEIKMQIAEILRNHEERKITNAPIFE